MTDLVVRMPVYARIQIANLNQSQTLLGVGCSCCVLAGGVGMRGVLSSSTWPSLGPDFSFRPSAGENWPPATSWARWMDGNSSRSVSGDESELLCGGPQLQLPHPRLPTARFLRGLKWLLLSAPVTSIFTANSGLIGSDKLRSAV